ncbi:hypothetical protein GLOTRDRAFT_140360 [Gloeophyllum trabeum ATCC 11539]|uniref:Uncharacterized protein n=1 Tax=Gloeophyllum trabeum (strain ATCC 11539 / FP-39264 / Madison 617) TaxID=670483 RepID=S7REP5_GLOTA|nr:uncharacterized protein GLOTRDRAFT_140360 [Gloeophyllum trabeum ATCC 11539]EPQ52720.1 hypothetical protein GLOTRDRAFT_140360 [Gloeophyllum trabeum ATCC 11539]
MALTLQHTGFLLGANDELASAPCICGHADKPSPPRFDCVNQQSYFIMGIIISTIAAAVTAVVTGVVAVASIILGVIATIIIGIFDIIFDILCCNCFGARTRRTGTHTYWGSGGLFGPRRAAAGPMAGAGAGPGVGGGGLAGGPAMGTTGAAATY